MNKFTPTSGDLLAVSWPAQRPPCLWSDLNLNATSAERPLQTCHSALPSQLCCFLSSSCHSLIYSCLFCPFSLLIREALKIRACTASSLLLEQAMAQVEARQVLLEWVGKYQSPHLSQPWWLMSEKPALRRKRQMDIFELRPV